MRTVHTGIESAEKNGKVYRVCLGTGNNLNALGAPHVGEVKFDDYRVNPIVLVEHNQRKLPVAQITEIEYVPTTEKVMASLIFNDDLSDIDPSLLDPDVPKVHHAWDKGILRGASMGIYPETHQLREVSLTPVPFDPTALRVAHLKLFDDWLDHIDDSFLTASYVDKEPFINDTTNNSSSRDVEDKESDMAETIDTSALTRQIGDSLKTQFEAFGTQLVNDLSGAIATAMTKADADAKSAVLQAEASASQEAERLDNLLNERMEKLGLVKNEEDGDEGEETHKTEEELRAEIKAEFEAEAEANAGKDKDTEGEETTNDNNDPETPEQMEKRIRAEVVATTEERNALLQVASLMLPDDFEDKDKSNLDIIKAALGDAAGESEDESYLRGKLEVLAEARQSDSSDGTNLITGSFNGGVTSKKDSPYNKYVERITNAYKNTGSTKVE